MKPDKSNRMPFKFLTPIVFSVLYTFAQASVAATEHTSVPLLTTEQGPFYELCVSSTNSPEVINTLSILLEKINLVFDGKPETCQKATEQLMNTTELTLGATRYTERDFIHRALNPVTTLEPIKLLPHLKSLVLILHNVDLKPLLDLKELETLDLRPENMGFKIPKVINLQPLEHMPQLKSLSIDNFDLKDADVKSIFSLTQLQKLTVIFNHLTDTSGFTNLTHLKSLKFYTMAPALNTAGFKSLEELEELDLGGAEIRSLEDFSHLFRLKKLRINQFDKKGIQDVSPLRMLTQLEYLNLAGNSIQSVEPLAYLRNLRFLSIHMNKVEDIFPLAGLTQLEHLYLGYNLISDLTPLSKMQSLVVLSGMKNKIQDVSPLQNLPHLEDLDLSQNIIEDARALTYLPRLRVLNLGLNKLKTLVGFANSPIVNLSLHYNLLTDLLPLSQMKTLQTLVITGNNIQSVAPLAPLTDLETLLAIHIPARDFDSLMNLEKEHENSQGKRIRLHILKD